MLSQSNFSIIEHFMGIMFHGTLIVIEINSSQANLGIRIT